MTMQAAGKSDRASPLGLGRRGLIPNLYDCVIFVLVASALVLLAHGVHQMGQPLARLDLAPVTLDPANLPEYALRTTLRMFAAILASLVFTLVVATLAAKSRKAELVIVPALDILQSVPVLGFLTFTVVLFMRLFPGSQLGAECASIFAIFTAQAWNMTFSFYQSLRTVPSDLDEVSRHFRLSGWLRLRLPRRMSWRPRVRRRPLPPLLKKASDALWITLVLAGAGYAVWRVAGYATASLGRHDVLEAVGLGALTLLRVMVLIAIASAIWVPVGVWIGLRPWAAERVQPIAQFLAAFPANVLFPIAVAGIVYFRLDPNIWLSPLMVLGTQWYILFNVIAGASAFPTDLREAATLYRLRSAQWWRDVILPGIFPYYITGALTASGGSWNASIVAEVASWGDTKLEAAGLGAYIAKATEAGDIPRVVLGIAVMSIFVVTFNRLLWRPLFRLAERRFRLE